MRRSIAAASFVGAAAFASGCGQAPAPVQAPTPVQTPKPMQAPGRLVDGLPLPDESHLKQEVFRHAMEALKKENLQYREIVQVNDPRELSLLVITQTRPRDTLEGGESTFQPSRFEASPAPAFLGVFGESRRADGKWTRVSQLFHAPPYRILLTEWDYAADGGGVHVLPGFQTIKVHDIAASRVCRVSAVRHALCQVTWTTPARHYEIRVEGTFHDGMLEDTRRWAEAVARSPG
jgi:hypothetical protein